jgi:hypothetical protein
MDRRAAFFLAAALVSALLIPITEQHDRWVPTVLAVVYVLLAIASWADRRTRAGRLSARHARPDRSSARLSSTPGEGGCDG